MNPRLQDLHDRIRHIKEAIEQQLRRRRAELHADFEHRRVAFEQEVLAQQRRFRQGLLRCMAESQWRNVVTAPLIYPLLLPLLLVDLSVTLYQGLCFPLYRVAWGRRRDHMVFERTHLGYLNLIEKLNGAYGSYANGLSSYVREVVARTQQYWCPIKHARRVLGSHPYLAGYADHGDAQGCREGLQSLREALARLDDASSRAPTCRGPGWGRGRAVGVSPAVGSRLAAPGPSAPAPACREASADPVAASAQARRGHGAPASDAAAKAADRAGSPVRSAAVRARHAAPPPMPARGPAPAPRRPGARSGAA